MRKLLYPTIILLPVLTASSMSAADWCIPGEGCTDAEPIDGKSFNTCEETCTMRNATPVRDMDATLFDVTCEGDSSNSQYRMLMGQFKGFDGGTRAYIVTPNGPQELERCPL